MGRVFCLLYDYNCVGPPQSRSDQSEARDDLHRKQFGLRSIVLEFGVGLFTFAEGAVEEVPIDGQQHSEEGRKGAPPLRLGDCDAVEDVVDSHDEDGSGGVQRVDYVYWQIEEGLREDEAVYHQQNVAHGHHSDGLSAEPHFILQHFRQIEEEKHHST